jgi:hypothetical protein
MVANVMPVISIPVSQSMVERSAGDAKLIMIATAYNATNLPTKFIVTPKNSNAPNVLAIKSASLIASVKKENAWDARMIRIVHQSLQAHCVMTDFAALVRLMRIVIAWDISNVAQAANVADVSKIQIVKICLMNNPDVFKVAV